MKSKHDWKRFDAMSEDEVVAAANNDADTKPLSDREFARVTRTPQVKTIRRALKLSQEEFANRFRIPVGTLRDWEQGRKAPDAATRAYLVVIARNPEAVSNALAASAKSAA